jgi:hypothetical protein
MYFMSMHNVWYHNICNTYVNVYDDGKRVEDVYYLWSNVYLVQYSDGTHKEVLHDYMFFIVEHET